MKTGGIMTVEEKAREYTLSCECRSDHQYDKRSSFEGYLAGYQGVMRWRNPKVDPPTNKDVVLVKTDNNCYATAYYHGKASGFITYGEDAYVEFGEIIGWRPIE